MYVTMPLYALEKDDAERILKIFSFTFKYENVKNLRWTFNLLSFLLRCSTRPHEWGTQ